MKYAVLSALLFFGSSVADEQFLWLIPDNDPQKVPHCVLKAAEKRHAWLNTSWCFVPFTSLNQLFDQAEESIVKLELETSNKTSFKAYFFDRKSETAIVVVPPYGGSVQQLIRYAAIFKEYDLLVLDYGGSQHTSLLGRMYAMLTAPRPSSIKKRQEYVVRALEWLRNKGNTRSSYGYKEIIGCGQCYGAWLMLHAQKNCVRLGSSGFDKLIIDSCSPGVDELRKKTAQDPVAALTFGKTEGPRWLKRVLSPRCVWGSLLTISSPFYPQVCITTLLQEVSVPVLFFHGRADLLVDDEEFQRLYDAVPHDYKCALITPFKHLLHNIKAKELYREITSEFIEGMLFAKKN